MEVPTIRMQTRREQHDFLADNGHPEEGLTADAIASMCADGKHCHIHPQHGAVLITSEKNLSRYDLRLRSSTPPRKSRARPTARGVRGIDYNDGG